MLDALDAAAVRQWSHATLELLTEHRAQLDALNVFPVADADTGQNLLSTWRAADAELETSSDTADPGAAFAALATGAARGALGNSGFITSQVIRGLASVAAAAAPYDAAAVARGLDAGAQMARAAVVAPVEGTVLTVARAAADAACAAFKGDEQPDLATVVRLAAAEADAALQRTPDQLPELARAGVVDAGGRGLVLVLAALVRTVTGAAAELTAVRAPVSTDAVAGRGVDRGIDRSDPAAPDGGRRVEVRDVEVRQVEVQYELDATAAAVDALRTTLAAIGDSVAVVNIGADSWKVHVHVDVNVPGVGAAIEAGLDAGRPRHISVVDLGSSGNAGSTGSVGTARAPQQFAGPAAVLAVAPGPGLAALLTAEGVRVVESIDPAQIVAAIRASGSVRAVLLANISRGGAVAEQAAQHARASGVDVSVVPVRSPVQCLAAVAVHDPLRRVEDDVVAMAEAAASTRWAELTVAADQGLTAVGICQPGDVLGLIDGEVVAIGRGLLAVAFTVVDRLLGIGAELITVLVGEGTPKRTGDLIEAHVRGRAPFTDVTVLTGGPAELPVVIGAE